MEVEIPIGQEKRFWGQIKPQTLALSELDIYLWTAFWFCMLALSLVSVSPNFQPLTVIVGPPRRPPSRKHRDQHTVNSSIALALLHNIRISAKDNILNRTGKQQLSSPVL